LLLGTLPASHQLVSVNVTRGQSQELQRHVQRLVYFLRLLLSKVLKTGTQSGPFN